jgi:hypothetical protein
MLHISKLQIVTNYNTYGPFGTWTPSGQFSYTVPADEIVVGFYAKTKDIINTIGVYTI